MTTMISPVIQGGQLNIETSKVTGVLYGEKIKAGDMFAVSRKLIGDRTSMPLLARDLGIAGARITNFQVSPSGNVIIYTANNNVYTYKARNAEHTTYTQAGNIYLSGASCHIILSDEYAIINKRLYDISGTAITLVTDFPEITNISSSTNQNFRGTVIWVSPTVVWYLCDYSGATLTRLDLENKTQQHYAIPGIGTSSAALRVSDDTFVYVRNSGSGNGIQTTKIMVAFNSYTTEAIGTDYIYSQMMKVQIISSAYGDGTPGMFWAMNDNPTTTTADGYILIYDHYKNKLAYHHGLTAKGLNDVSNLGKIKNIWNNDTYAFGVGLDMYTTSTNPTFLIRTSAGFTQYSTFMGVTTQSGYDETLTIPFGKSILYQYRSSNTWYVHVLYPVAVSDVFIMKVNNIRALPYGAFGVGVASKDMEGETATVEVILTDEHL